MGTTNSYYLDGIAAAWSGDTNCAAIAAHTNGETLTAMTQTDALGNVVRVTGAVWSLPSSPPCVVYVGTNGLPDRAMVADQILLFGNYTSNSVDVAYVSPAGTNCIYRGVPLPHYACALIAQASAPKGPQDGPQPKDDGGLTLQQTLQLAGIAVGAFGCAAAIISTEWAALPVIALPCGGLVISVVNALLPQSNPALVATGSALNTIGCITGTELYQCAGAALNLARAIAALFDSAQITSESQISSARLLLAYPPLGMVPIPAGSFTMGNCMNSSEGYPEELPVHTVYVSAFYMDKYLVTKSLWDTVYQWGIARGYTFWYPGHGSGKASSHPVQMLEWYDCVKWCNARSEMEGRVPAYYTSAAQTTPYRMGQVEVQNGWVKWIAGYRMPTEAEWEKAARGGVAGRRFPWGNTISWSQANYYALPLSADPFYGYAYDVNPTIGHNPTFTTGGEPYTSPVGYFAANSYGLYDMAGNVSQWCWDWYGSYASGSQTDPRGPTSGSARVYRGGNWFNWAFQCRTANRDNTGPANDYDMLGFRSVLPLGQ